MPALAVQKTRDTEGMTPPLFDEMKRLFGEVERKAFDLFQRRGCSLGHALDDWLQAERETLAPPPAELAETPNEFAIRMAVPGFSAKEVQVNATPMEIIVKAEHPEKKASEEGVQIRWSELPENGKVCRRVILPAPVDVDKITATLDQGVLRIKAAKASEAPRREVPVGKGA